MAVSANLEEWRISLLRGVCDKTVLRLGLLRKNETLGAIDTAYRGDANIRVRERRAGAGQQSKRCFRHRREGWMGESSTIARGCPGAATGGW